MACKPRFPLPRIIEVGDKWYAFAFYVVTDPYYRLRLPADRLYRDNLGPGFRSQLAGKCR